MAQELLGRGKHISSEDRGAEISRLYLENPRGLAEYNLEDCRLVAEIFERTGLLPYLLERQQLTGLALDRLGGSVAAFDYLYLPRLHRHGRVAPSIGPMTTRFEASPGGYVLDSKPGLYDNVLVLDFKSLYPSIIRTFKIDPLGLAAPGDDPVSGFEGATFSRDEHILPELIATLWTARDAAKAVFAGGGDASGVPSCEIPAADFEAGINILDLFSRTELCSSKSEARRLVQQGGARVNDEKIDDVDAVVGSDAVRDSEVMLKAGKKRFFRVVVA